MQPINRTTNCIPFSLFFYPLDLPVPKLEAFIFHSTSPILRRVLLLISYRNFIRNKATITLTNIEKSKQEQATKVYVSDYIHI